MKMSRTTLITLLALCAAVSSRAALFADSPVGTVPTSPAAIPVAPVTVPEAAPPVPAAPEAAPQARPPSPVLTMGAEATYDHDANKTPSVRPYLSFGFDAKYFELIATLSGNTDGKYGLAQSNLANGKFLNLYFLLEEGGLRSHLGPVTLSAGRFRHYDEIDSPYSLFINSNGNSAILLQARYEDDFFFFETRWIELNYRSLGTTNPNDPVSPAWLTGFPDRGANYRVYGFKIAPGMRFGFQDENIYTGRSFDLEYFADPTPGYFLDYANSEAGRPWTTDWASKYLVGSFWDWKRDDGLSFNAQVLVADFNIHALVPSSTNNPWKLAWTVGGRKETSIGTFSLYQAGALKYTFEPLTMSNSADEVEKSFGASYYPDTQFYVNGDAQPISVEDNALGYKYGENNAVIMADWTKKVAGYDLGAYLEFRLAGSNSPANPWDGAASVPQGTRWLDDPVLEKRILAGFSMAKRDGDWRYYGILSGGVAFDQLTLQAPAGSPGLATDVNNNVYIWTPTPGRTQPILRLTLGAAYSWRMR